MLRLQIILHFSDKRVKNSYRSSKCLVVNNNKQGFWFVSNIQKITSAEIGHNFSLKSFMPKALLWNSLGLQLAQVKTET